MSQVLAAPKTYDEGRDEGEAHCTPWVGHPVNIVSTQVINVGLPSLDQMEEIKARFNQALNILNLKPYLHSSQAASIVMPPVIQQDQIIQEDGSRGKSHSGDIQLPATDT